MGGLTYLFALTTNLILALLLGGIGALACALLHRYLLFPQRYRARWVVGSFLSVFVGINLFGLWWMATPHERELKEADAAAEVSLLVSEGAQYGKGVHVAHGDAAQSFYLLKGNGAQASAVAQQYQLKGQSYDGDELSAKGWPVPDWWPGAACPSGTSYHPDLDQSSVASFSMFACPARRTIVIIHYEY